MLYNLHGHAIAAFDCGITNSIASCGNPLGKCIMINRPLNQWNAYGWSLTNTCWWKIMDGVTLKSKHSWMIGAFSKQLVLGIGKFSWIRGAWSFQPEDSKDRCDKHLQHMNLRWSLLERKFDKIGANILPPLHIVFGWCTLYFKGIIMVYRRWPFFPNCVLNIALCRRQLFSKWFYTFGIWGTFASGQCLAKWLYLDNRYCSRVTLSQWLMDKPAILLISTEFYMYKTQDRCVCVL